MTHSAIPEPNLRRMPMYLLYLQKLTATDVKSISCVELGKALGLDASQIRKDFETADIHGKPKVGYAVGELIRSLEDRLGWNQRKPAVLAGAGPLGRALLGSETLKKSGLDVVGIFDSDGREIGSTADNREVMPLGFLPDVVRVHRVKLGIVAVGAATAQAVVDTMVKVGIEASWSVVPAVLFVPEGVILHNGDLCSSFAPLSARIAEKRKALLAMAPALQPGYREE